LSEKDPAPSGLAPQEVWRNRLAAAETVFREAALQLKQAVQQQDLSPSSDESLRAVALAHERKHAARREYLRVLRIFTDIVLRGKAPPPED
jgi:hypothetical protein